MKLLDNEGGHVTSAMGCQGSIIVANATLWWPYLMSENPGYMYTLMVKFLVLFPLQELFYKQSQQIFHTYHTVYVFMLMKT